MYSIFVLAGYVIGLYILWIVLKNITKLIAFGLILLFILFAIFGFFVYEDAQVIADLYDGSPKLVETQDEEYITTDLAEVTNKTSGDHDVKVTTETDITELSEPRDALELMEHVRNGTVKIRPDLYILQLEDYVSKFTLKRVIG